MLASATSDEQNSEGAITIRHIRAKELEVEEVGHSWYAMLEELNLYDESNIHFDSLRDVFYGDAELNVMDLDGD